MRYLIVGEVKRTPPVPPEQFLELGIASVEALAAQEKAGKIVAGGIFAGRPGGFGVVEAQSHEEVDEFIRSLPFWAFLDWEVTPTVSYQHRIETGRKSLAQLKVRGVGS